MGQRGPNKSEYMYVFSMLWSQEDNGEETWVKHKGKPCKHLAISGRQFRKYEGSDVGMCLASLRNSSEVNGASSEYRGIVRRCAQKGRGEPDHRGPRRLGNKNSDFYSEVDHYCEVLSKEVARSDWWIGRITLAAVWNGWLKTWMPARGTIVDVTLVIEVRDFCGLGWTVSDRLRRQATFWIYVEGRISKIFLWGRWKMLEKREKPRITPQRLVWASRRMVIPFI